MKAKAILHAALKKYPKVRVGFLPILFKMSTAVAKPGISMAQT
ncbi:unnamed protein product [Plutella xylostella]|uniref:(diamondback moth) hypothetical protein n=1 Tax=Plutella xylostella TaxID=51655 RepID=A0A8S4GA15_PLUXY|nr:unnamed protein product [Plutella xylostella]